MIDKMLQEKKAVVGKNGYMERSGVKKLTRSLRLMWQRNTKFGYDGSKEEWELWRRDTEMEKNRISNGGASKESTADTHTDANMSNLGILEPNATTWQQADLAALSTKGHWNTSRPTAPEVFEIYNPPISPISTPRVTIDQDDSQLNNALGTEVGQHTAVCQQSSITKVRKLPIKKGSRLMQRRAKGAF
jgi:hypothetical protein